MEARPAVSESRLVALARQAQNLQPERRTNTLSELRGRWSDYVNPYQTPPQQLSDLANPLRWPAMAVEGIQTAVETVPRMLQPGYDYSDTRQAAEDAFNVAGVVGAGSLLGTAAKPANAVGAFGGKLGGAASDLDMSQAARMARAKEMGFDTDQVWYHGTPNEFDEFDAGPIWLSNDKNTAREFGLDRKGLMAPRFGGSAHAWDTGKAYVMELRAPTNMKTVDVWLAANKTALEMGVDTPKNWDEVANLLNWGEWQNEIIDEALKQGFSGVRFLNVLDSPSGRPSDHAVVFDPSNIRSVNAAFDPAKSDSANLLASRGAPVPVEQRRRRDKDEIF